MVLLTGLTADKNLPPRRTISVLGTAVARVPPDLIVWHLSLSDSDKEDNSPGLAWIAMHLGFGNTHLAPRHRPVPVL